MIVENRADISSLPDNIISNESDSNLSPPADESSEKAEKPLTPKQMSTDTKTSTLQEQNYSSPIPTLPTQTDNIFTESPTFRLKISPLARKLAIQSNIDLSTLKSPGSGPGNRIIECDIQSIIEKRKKSPISSKSLPKKTTTAISVEKPLTNMRRVIFYSYLFSRLLLKDWQSQHLQSLIFI